MRKYRRGLVLTAALCATFLIYGCQKTEIKETTAAQTEMTATVPTSEITGEKTRVFTDSAGRKVTLPEEIQKIAPSGPLAQIVLYTVAPDKLAGLASDFSDGAKKYIDEKYWGYPSSDNFMGRMPI